MGIPAPAGIAASGAPPAGDQANAVVTGSFAAVGPGACFALLGAFNFALWGSVVQTLTTTAGSAAATVGSATGLAIGQTVKGAFVPPGTTIGNLVGLNVTLAFPPGVTAAAVKAGADANAVFAGAVWAGSVQVERSFDGGSTWLVVGVGGAGQGAIYSGATQNGQPVSITGSEPEREVLYRPNCTAYASGIINYRFSTTGTAPQTWGVPGS